MATTMGVVAYCIGNIVAGFYGPAPIDDAENVAAGWRQVIERLATQAPQLHVGMPFVVPEKDGGLQETLTVAQAVCRSVALAPGAPSAVFGAAPRDQQARDGRYAP